MKRAFLAMMCTWGCSLAHAQVAVPYYTASHVWQGLYQVHLPQQARAFAQTAQALRQTVHLRCDDASATPELNRQWQTTLQAWVSMSTPAMGTVLSRRSQRQIDFSPIRLTLLNQSLARLPRNQEEWARVGTPAKGFSALEWVLQPPRDVARCAYALGLAQDIERESQALLEDTLSWSVQPLEEERVGAAFAEWVNQWLGAWERLRWGQIEQPIQKARTSGKSVAWARKRPEHNTMDWQAQWRVLYSQARLSPSQRLQPPEPGRGVIPIEALLLGKGHIALAQRWGQALDRLDLQVRRLNANSSPQAWEAWARGMKVVTVLFQNEVAAALDVPLGFSDADGD
jgi:predicted lipoprotein